MQSLGFKHIRMSLLSDIAAVVLSSCPDSCVAWTCPACVPHSCCWSDACTPTSRSSTATCLPPCSRCSNTSTTSCSTLPACGSVSHVSYVWICAKVECDFVGCSVHRYNFFIICLLNLDLLHSVYRGNIQSNSIAIDNYRHL